MNQKLKFLLKSVGSNISSDRFFSIRSNQILYKDRKGYFCNYHFRLGFVISYVSLYDTKFFNYDYVYRIYSHKYEKNVNPVLRDFPHDITSNVPQKDFKFFIDHMIYKTS